MFLAGDVLVLAKAKLYGKLFHLSTDGRQRLYNQKVIIHVKLKPSH